MIGRGSTSRRRLLTATFTFLLAGCVAPQIVAAAAQVEAPERELLRDQVRRRFEVIPLREGVGLIPRQSGLEARLIEIVDRSVLINGQIVSGAELQDRMGRDADLVMQLSFLDNRTRREVLGLSQPAASPVQPPVPETPAPPSSRPLRRSRDIVRIAGDVTVERDELVTGDVVVIAGDARIDGTVNGEVTVVAGSLRLGPESEVRRDITVIMSRLDRAPGARIDGELVDVGFNNLRVRIGELDFPNPFTRPAFIPFLRFMGLFGTLLRLGLLVLCGWLILTVARHPVQRIADRATAEPVKSGIVGVLVELLFLPLLICVSVLLAISVIGIPLLALIPVAVLGMGLVLVAGFTAIAMRVGEWVGWQLGSRPIDAYPAVTVGIVLLLALAVLARIAFLGGGLLAGVGIALAGLAFCVEYIAWTVGLGAAVLVRLSPRRPIPAVTSPSV